MMDDKWEEAFASLDRDDKFSTCVQAVYDAGWKDGRRLGYDLGLTHGRSVLTYSWIGIYSALCIFGGLIAGVILASAMWFGV